VSWNSSVRRRAELQRAVEVDVFLALGIAVGEMDVDVDLARHARVAELRRDKPLRRAAE